MRWYDQMLRWQAWQIRIEKKKDDTDNEDAVAEAGITKLQGTENRTQMGNIREEQQHERWQIPIVSEGRCAC